MWPDLSASGWATDFTYGEGYDLVQQRVPSLPPLTERYRSSAGPSLYSTGFSSLSEYPNVGAVIDAAFFRFALCDQMEGSDGVFDLLPSEEALAAGAGRDSLVCAAVQRRGVLQELYPRYGLQGLLVPFYPLPLFTSNWFLLEVSSFTFLLMLQMFLWLYLQPAISDLLRKYWHGRSASGERDDSVTGGTLAAVIRAVIIGMRVTLGCLLLFYALQLSLAWWEIYGELYDNWELPLFHPSAVPVAVLLWKSYLVMLAAMFWQGLTDNRTIAFFPNSLIFFVAMRHHASGQLLVYMPLLMVDEGLLVLGSFERLKILEYISSLSESVISYLWALNWFYGGVDIPLIYYMLYMQNFMSVVVPLSIYKSIFGDQLFTAAFFSITIGEYLYSAVKGILDERERRRRIAASPFTQFASREQSHRSFEGERGTQDGGDESDGDIPQEIMEAIERDYFGEDWASLSDGGGSNSLLERAHALVSKRLAGEDEEEKERMLEQYLCKICLVEPSNVVLDPCGHLCMCVDCAKRYAQHAASRRSYMRLCPICRADVSGSRRIYV